MTTLRKNLLLGGLAVVFVSAVIRFWGLGTNPPSLNWDETSLGYNAYAILKTGKDEWGKTLPITFRAFGEYKLPGYIYATVPSIAVFGLNEFAVRFPSAFFGVLTTLLVFLIAHRITKSILAATFGGLLFALTPWHFFLSRIAVEANLALFFVVLGFSLLLESLSRQKQVLFIFAMLSFATSLFTYNSARVFVPLFVTAVLVIYRKEVIHKALYTVAGLLVFYGLFALTIPLSFTDSNARYQAVTILDQGAINRINEQRGHSSLPKNYQRLVYNKATYFVGTAAKNYVHYFSPRFLFANGGNQYQFSLPNFGLLLAIELPLGIIGLFYLAKMKSKHFWVLLLWLLLAPIPAAITREEQHVLRSILLLPSFELFSTAGFFALLHGVSKNQFRQFAWISMIVVATGLQLIPYAKSYATEYPKVYSCSWQYGHKQVAQFVTQERGNYAHVLMTKRYGEPHIFMLFYQKIHPATYGNDPKLIREKRDNWYWVDRFDGYEFVNDWELQGRLKQITDENKRESWLVVTSPGNYPNNIRPFETIRFLDGTPAFELLNVNSANTKFSSGDLHPPKPKRGCFTNV